MLSTLMNETIFNPFGPNCKYAYLLVGKGYSA